MIKQKLNSFGGRSASTHQGDEGRCAFPLKPSTKQEISDYAMIEESVLENDRRGGFVRVYPNDAHLTTYRNFFEEERKSDTTLFNYIYVGKYRNMLVD